MNRVFVVLLGIFFLCAGMESTAQQAYRLKADFMMKVKRADSTFNLSKGKVYYDRNIRKLTFDVAFPEKEIYVSKDTILYTFVCDTLKQQTTSPIIPEHSYFNFILNDKFNSYGLEESSFSVGNIERNKDLVITTWNPPEAMQHVIGKILIGTKNKRLYSVIIQNTNFEIINRQIFKNYVHIKGTDIPSEVLNVTYLDSGGKLYQIISLSNIVLNEDSESKLYNYPVE